MNIRISVYGINHPIVASTYHNISFTFNRLKKYDSLLKYSQKSIQSRLKNFNRKHISLVSSYNSLGNYYKNIGHYDQALNLYQKA